MCSWVVSVELAKSGWWMQKQERAMGRVEDGGSCGKDRVVRGVLWSRREGTLVEWLEDSAGFGIGRKCLYE